MCHPLQEQAGADRVLGIPRLAAAGPGRCSALFPPPAPGCCEQGPCWAQELHSTRRATLAEQRGLQLQWPQVDSVYLAGLHLFM